MFKKTFSFFSIFLLASFCVGSFISCKSSQKEDYNDKNYTPTKTTYLALGDSYTIGESVRKKERYPMQLAEKIEYLSKNDDHKERIYFEEPHIIAKTGWTCEELMTAVLLAEQKNDFKKKYDIVSLLIGVNDQYGNEDTTKYAQRFEKLLQKAIGLAGKKAENVFVISIPDYGMTDFAKNKKLDPKKITAEIDFYNKINKEITLKYKVNYFDITPISRKAITDKELIAKDGLHPSEKMYREWVELMDEQLMEMILKGK